MEGNELFTTEEATWGRLDWWCLECSFSQADPTAGLPDGVPDEPQCVGDGDLLAGVQQLLVLQVKILYSHVTNHKTT